MFRFAENDPNQLLEVAYPVDRMCSLESRRKLPCQFLFVTTVDQYPRPGNTMEALCTVVAPVQKLKTTHTLLIKKPLFKKHGQHVQYNDYSSRMRSKEMESEPAFTPPTTTPPDNIFFPSTPYKGPRENKSKQVKTRSCRDLLSCPADDHSSTMTYE